ncbi:hypothetical protein BZA05DRAFT_382739 [Tricharina praecox]|uniref:uncharacterized protein n=1 Tax=Tricharina praecox TaxID=43433 RepID=UPI002220864F|nr:uncharacterized protein BZA05DRAFT_382739 [Tricharina praecox]KAI5858902.1 hypothetical protein BZA05DRAFT_382739 [Tricharina praecox]
MPRLNLLRPHRRAHSSQSSATPSSPASAVATPTSSSPPPPSTFSYRSILSALPPLDIGSPGLGSPGQWLDGTAYDGVATTATTTTTAVAPQAPQYPPPPRPPLPPPSQPPTPSTATATPPPSSIGAFSRTSTPYTALTSDTPAPRNKTSAMTPPSVGLHSRANENVKPEKVKEAGGKGMKLGRLNPMSLLRRRSSQRDLALGKDKGRSSRDLPDNFDPKIIYATRHPDWSSHPKRGSQDPRRSLSPVPVGPGSPGVPIKSDGKKPSRTEIEEAQGIDARISLSVSPQETRLPTRPPMPIPQIDKDLPPPPSQIPPPPPPPLAEETESLLPVAMTPEMPIVPEMPTSPSTAVFRPTSALSGLSGISDTPTEERRRRGVTLIDHPLAMPHYKAVNSSRFSFEGSSKSPSAAPSQKGLDSEEDDDRSSFADGSFQFNLDDEGYEDDGFERANEGLFGNDPISDELADQYNALQAAMDVMKITMAQQEQGIGMALSEDMPNQSGGEMEFGGFPTDDNLPFMDPQPLAAEQSAKDITLSSRQRMANPRNLELTSDDLDFMDDEQELAGYEDDDDDMYFDDGLITDYAADSETQDEQPQPSLLPQPQKLTIQPPSDDTTPASPPVEGYFGQVNPEFDAANRFSMVTQDTGISSGLIPQDGSMATEPEDPMPKFPPFINPIGGGLGFTPQQHQFYAPEVNGTLLNGYALSSLTSTLQQYQMQQQQLGLAGAPQSPSEGYDSDINERPNFGNDSDFDFSYDYDYNDDDDPMVAAANAEALANDSEGFYGSEFGFYSSNTNGGLSYAGGFFGNAGVNGELLRPPIRRPSLTPISERSESSYRNSLVFPVPGSQGGGWGSPGPLSPGSWGTDQGEELTLGQLLQLRRNAWGGSNGSMRSAGSGGNGGGAGSGSPVTSPVGSPLGWGAGSNALAAVSMGMPSVSQMNMGDQAAAEYLLQQQQQAGIFSPPLYPHSIPVATALAEPSSAEQQLIHQYLGMMSPPLRSSPPPPPGLSPPPGLGFGTTPPPPGLHHAGAKAMLPTKGSFEDPASIEAPW